MARQRITFPTIDGYTAVRAGRYWQIVAVVSELFNSPQVVLDARGRYRPVRFTRSASALDYLHKRAPKPAAPRTRATACVGACAWEPVTYSDLFLKCGACNKRMRKGEAGSE